MAVTRINGKPVNDPTAVAAFNSCVDWKKWQALPSSIRTRIKTLLDHHRLKFVCFSDDFGLGLRVYNEGQWDFSGDRASTKDQSVEVDTDGYWVQCDPSMWEEFNKKAEDPKFLIMSPDGRRYVKGESAVLDTVEWGLYRVTALKFDSREEAENAVRDNAALKDCVVVIEGLPGERKKDMPKPINIPDEDELDEDDDADEEEDDDE